MSVDHLCILWCKELILVIARALFDCVDLKSNLISEDAKLRQDVFKYHLIDVSSYFAEKKLHFFKSTLNVMRKFINHLPSK